MLLRHRPLPSGFSEPCLPSLADALPSGPDWVHEIKHDGFRMMVRRGAGGVRLLTSQRLRLVDPFAADCRRRRRA
jgi:ATP-dependent DNA ligase